MELSEREKLLIVEGLGILKFQLGGIPKSEEVRALTNKIQDAWKITLSEKSGMQEMSQRGNAVTIPASETCTCNGYMSHTAQDTTVHKHEWEVYSTAIIDRCIMVRCNCGTFGNIPNEKFEHTDWNDAFSAPSAPYPLRKGLVAAVEMGIVRLPR